MYKTILVLLNGSKRAEAILDHIKELAESLKAKVLFLHISEQPLLMESGYDKTKDMSAQQHQEQRRKQVESYLAGIFEAMVSPAFYPHAVSAIEQRDTHISKVFLTGDYAYKIKKPVNLEFLDFTTLEKRRYFCRQELVLNRRLAPDVYLDVVPITFKNSRYYLAGPGRPVEYAVKIASSP